MQTPEIDVAEKCAPAPDREELIFSDDPKAQRASWVAALFLIALFGWIGSGFLNSVEHESNPEKEPPRQTEIIAPMSVAKPVEMIFTSIGESKPRHEAWIIPQLSGRIKEMIFKKGDLVKAGDVVARLEDSPQLSALEQARTELRAAERDLANARTLLDRGVATVTRVTESEKALRGAQATLASAEDDVSRTEMKASFSGHIDVLEISPGRYLEQGAEVLKIVDVSTIIVSFRVPQQAIAKLTIGNNVSVSLPDGSKRSGKLTFLSRRADVATRTFAAEAELENADLSIPGGISLKVTVDLPNAKGHFVPSSVLSIDETGALGLKTVSENNKVSFRNVEIIRAADGGFWISGLEDKENIITRGQGFVGDGDVVASGWQQRAEEHMSGSYISVAVPRRNTSSE